MTMHCYCRHCFSLRGREQIILYESWAIKVDLVSYCHFLYQWTFLINSQTLKLFSSSVYRNNMFLVNHYTICLSQGGNKTISKSFPCLHVSGHGLINIIQADRSRAPNLILLAKFNYMQIPKTTALLSLVFFVSDTMINNHQIAASC